MLTYKNKFVLHGVGIFVDEYNCINMSFLENDYRIKEKADREKLCDNLMRYMKDEGFLDVSKLTEQVSIKFITVKSLKDFDDNAYNL